MQNLDHQTMSQRNNHSLGWAENWHYAIIIMIVAIKNWFLEAVPFVSKSNGVHDDALFIRQAINITQGKWLGDFDHYILIKGPIYPLWMAANYFTGISIIHSQDLLYFAACLVVTRAVMVDVKSKLLIIIIFSFLYLNPISFDVQSIAQVFRMVIYTSLTLMTFGALLGLLLRHNNQEKRFYLWSLLFGISLSLFWYTREEGKWILPGLIFVVFVALVVNLYQQQWRQFGRGLIGFVLIPLTMWAATTGGLTYLNWKHYGVTYVIEVLSPNFQRAYNGLLRVQPDEFRRFYPVRAQTIELLMNESDKMAELTAFEGLGERPAAMFIWAFRQGVAHAGYYVKGAQAVNQYYADLADELEALCDNQTLKCAKLPMANVPPWQPIYTKEFMGILAKQFTEVVRFRAFSTNLDRFYSYGGDRYLKEVERLSHARTRIRRGEQKQIQQTFFQSLDQFKLAAMQYFGEIQLPTIRVVFYLALLALAGLFVKNVISAKYNPYVIYSCSVVGSILVLCIGLTIIELTSYSALFRAQHGVLPLPRLFILCVILSYAFNYDKNNKHAE